MLDNLRKIRQILLSQTIVAASKVNIVENKFGRNNKFALQKGKNAKDIQRKVNDKTKKYKITM